MELCYRQYGSIHEHSTGEIYLPGKRIEQRRHMERSQHLDYDYRKTAIVARMVYGAFISGMLKGFVSVEPEIFGGENRYMDFSSIHVSEDMRGKGIGKALFSFAKEWAREHGAKKLYISSHSAIESQKFYEAMGCEDAVLCDQRHVEAEPYDRQLECKL